MSTQYFCKNENRRRLVRKHATLNGIDYLEVLDHDAPPGSPRQRTLLVRLFKPVPASLTRANVRILGGVRVTPVKVTLAVRALIGTGLTAVEKAFVAALPNADHVLVVRTDSDGDYSTYHLALVASPLSDAPPTDFDPQLSEIAFSFKVECASDFDCQRVTECPPRKFAEPAIDYLARDYASFRRLMLDRLSVVMPQWQERHPADVLVAVVEALAHSGDRLSYFQDAVATEAYLGTARRRISVRRHARTLDYRMHDGCNARTWVVVEVKPGGNADGKTLAAQTPVVARHDDGRAVDPVADLEHEPIVFETMHNATLSSAHNAIPFYTWGDTACCLPRGATRATLSNKPALSLKPGDVLIFEEVVSPTTGLEADADPTHRQAVRLTKADAKIDLLTTDPVLEIAWMEADALTFPLCLTALIGGASEMTQTSIARGNTVLADQGWRRSDESLVPPRAPADGPYRPQLEHPGITFAVPYDDEAARGAKPGVAAMPATQLLAQTPGDALPSGAHLDDTNETWTVQRELLSSDRFALDWMIEMESDARAHLRFGDDVLGRKPQGGAELKATYRVGNGRGGNVGSETLGRLVTTQFTDILRVRNPLPASGGTDPESIEEARQFAPAAFRTQKRAVTEADYAEMAGRHPEVQRAAARFRWTGSWYTVFVFIDRRGGRPVEADPIFKNAIREHLERFRIAGYDLEVKGPGFVPLDILVMVCVAPGYFRAHVRQSLLRVFSAGDFADGGRGFFHPDNFTFGDRVYLSPIYERAMKVDGVASVEVQRFQRWGKTPNQEIDNGVLAAAPLEIVRLDNDPNFPENGKIEFEMHGGL